MKKLFLYGAGRRGMQFFIDMREKIDIEGFFDSNSEKKEYLGKRVLFPYYDKDNFIIVTVDDYIKYFDIRDILSELGYKEFESFIPWQIYEKKMVVAYGNCHMEQICKYLLRNPLFKSEYGLYPFPPICDIKTFGLMDRMNLKKILSNCNIFLHQCIREDNVYGKEYSSKEYIVYLNDDCKILSLPNLYGLPICFFPQTVREYWAHYNFINGIETNIRQWISEGKTKEEMAKLIEYGGVYSKEYIIDLWKDFCIKLESREQEWDIKISDFIYDNYKNVKLFYERWHITPFLAREMANRTIVALGGEPIDDVLIWCDDRYEEFIYADVKDALDIQFTERSIRNNSITSASLHGTSMDVHEFVDMCIKVYKQK